MKAMRCVSEKKEPKQETLFLLILKSWMIKAVLLVLM